MTTALAPQTTSGPHVRIRPVVLIRALAKHIWHTRGAQIKRRLPCDLAILIALLLVRDHYALALIDSPSVAPSLVIVDKQAPVTVGALAAYRYPGLARGDYRRGDGMIHWIAAGEGAVITVEGRTVFIDGKAVGVAKQSSYRLEALTPMPAGIVPKDSYYVMGTHADALDSRYAEAGFVHKNDLIGRAWVVF